MSLAGDDRNQSHSLSLLVVPIALCLGLKDHGPRRDEPEHLGIPPWGVLDERDGDRVLDVPVPVVECGGDGTQATVQNVNRFCGERRDRESADIGNEKVEKDCSIEVAEVFLDDGFRLRAVLEEVFDDRSFVSSICSDCVTFARTARPSSSASVSAGCC